MTCISHVLPLLIVILLTGNGVVFSHLVDDSDDINAGNFDIRITGAINGRPISNQDRVSRDVCRPGKAGPKGDLGMKGEKGDPADACDCSGQARLEEKIAHLQGTINQTSGNCVLDKCANIFLDLPTVVIAP